MSGPGGILKPFRKPFPAARPGIIRFRVRLRLLLLSAFILGAQACRFKQRQESPPATAAIPAFKKVTWMGNLAIRYAESALDGSDSEACANAPPLNRHDFDFPGLDSARLSLLEFSDAWKAYAAFQSSAGPVGMADGCYRRQGDWIFQHGRFLGTLESGQGEAGPASFLRENLEFPGEELYTRPEEFSAFPLLGRIPHSERIIARHFLGRNWQGPVFTVSYRCHADTATAFRAWSQATDSAKTWLATWTGKIDTLNWGRDLHFYGQDEFHRPLLVWFLPDGVMGFAGCYDPVLVAEYAQKMQKTAIFWPKP
jgi:hypothetical protein